MKDVFIVNPKSGKNNQYELIKEIKEHFQGKRIIIEKTKGPEHATFIAKKYALSNEPVHLFVCGGDGTLHEVINGCAEKENVIISVIPIGTGNDFVKYFEDLKREMMATNRDIPAMISAPQSFMKGTISFNVLIKTSIFSSLSLILFQVL